MITKMASLFSLRRWKKRRFYVYLVNM